MKANELMIGDYVKFLGRVRKINSIIKKDTGVEISFEGKNPVVVSLDEIEPVALTPEILEKNGFINKKGRFMQKGNFDDPPLIMWHLVNDEILGHPKSQLEIHHGAKSMHVSLVCIYVHALQHALRDCGIEKEIEL